MASGRYRVTINGFAVKTETWDHAFEVDGKRDEVYCSSLVSVLNKDGQTVYSGERTSETLGDVNGQPGRIKAGTASRRGGLRTNDKFPTATPWIRAHEVSPERNYPPMTIWEGELAEGDHVAVITPSIWEWDGGKDAFGDWVAWGQQTVGKVRDRLQELLGPDSKVVLDWIELGLDVAVSIAEPTVIGQAGDRPIGMAKDGNQYVFRPQVIALNYHSAERLVQDNPMGLGHGVIALRFADDSTLKGDYSLYMQVEKISTGSQHRVIGARALRAANGQYVCAEGGGGREVVANRDQILGWETFSLIDLGNSRVALRAANGQYVCAEGGGGREVVANRDQILGWETFELVSVG
jgi:hypothetical protein